MSGVLQTWYSAAQLDAFADRSAVLRERLALDRLSRLRELLGAGAGTVDAVLELAPCRAGWTPAELRFETRVEMTCQRCLEPVEIALAERVELGFVESAAREACLPEGRVGVIVEDRGLNIVELLEDELIVSLPLVPRHERAADCGSLARDPVRADTGAEALETNDYD